MLLFCIPVPGPDKLGRVGQGPRQLRGRNVEVSPSILEPVRYDLSPVAIQKPTLITAIKTSPCELISC